MELLAELPQPNLSEKSVNRGVASVVSVGQAMAPLPTLRLSLPGSLVSSFWVKPVLARLATAMSLRSGWDSYAGMPTSVASAGKTFQFLAQVLEPLSAPPTIIPLSDGGLQLVWSRQGLDVEATFGAEDAELYIRSPEGEYSGDPSNAESVAAFNAIRDQLRP